MNTITNLNTFPIGNSLDGINIVTDEINTLSLLVDGTNSMLADLNMDNHLIRNLDAGIDSLDAVNKSQLDLKADKAYVDTQDSLRVLKSGDTMTGALNMNSTNKIINVANGTNPADVVNFSQLTDLRTYTDSSLNSLKAYVNTQDNLKVNKSGDTMSGQLALNFSNANLDIRTTDENQDAILYLSTPYQNGATNRRKTAIIADGINNWNRANLHFCLNQQQNHDGVVSVSDSRMCILNGGNVGIGTTAPSEKLDVNGNTIIRGSLNMNSNKISNLLNPTLAQDATTKNYVDASLNLLRAYVDTQDTNDRTYVDASLNLKVNRAGDTMTGSLNISLAGASTTINKQLNLQTNNNGLWFNPYFSGGAWNPLIENGAKGIIFSNGTPNTGELFIAPWSDYENGVKISSSGVTTLNKNATTSNSSTTDASAFLDLTTGTIYEKYNLTYNGAVEIWLSYTGSGNTNLQNKLIHFNLSANTTVKIKPKQHLNYTSTDSTCIINGITYTDYAGTPNPPYTSLNLSSSFGLSCSSTIGTYNTMTFDLLTNTDQLTLKSSLGTDANSEFMGIRFLGTNTECGFIRVDTNKAHTDANMSFTILQSSSLITPLVINSNINAYRPIIRNAWSSGELIQTKIYNQNTDGTGVLQLNGGSGATTWKSVTFTMQNTVSDSYLCVEVFAPYHLTGAGQDRVLAQIRDYTSSTEQEVLLTGQYWDNNTGGGTRSGIILPLMASFTPTSNTSTKTRTIDVRFNNYTNDTLYICRIVNASNIIADCNYYTIKISEYKK
jgi:hypothetical protein